MAAVTLLLLVASVLGQLAEYHWVFDLFTHFTWHYFLAGLLLAIPLLWLRQWAWALLALAVAIFHYPMIDGYAGNGSKPCAAPGQGEELRILQFNIGRGNDKLVSFYSWLENQSPSAHIIIILEASERLAPLIETLKKSGWSKVLTEYRRDNYGIAVVSSIRDTRLSLEYIGDPYLPSIVIQGTTDDKALPFTVIATHPPPPLTAELAEVRNLLLGEFAERARQRQDDNFVIAGDLNLTHWSPWFSRLLDDGGLLNAQRGFGYGGTFPAFGLPSLLALPIDHTLVSPNIRVLHRSVGPGSGLGSDHRPVETRLWLTRCLTD